ncbi:MAG: fibronectin type III domain-containing protein [Bryobacteraceae bacterium]
MRREFLAVVGIGLFVFSIPAWAQASACDVVTTGTTPTQSDVNAAINMAIGTSTCTLNIMGANVCNVVVVQRIVNAVLGQGCVVGTHSVAVSWGASTAGTYPIAGYNVYRAPSSAPTQYVQINTALVTALTYTDGAVSNSATYYYAITAVDTQGTQSGYSTPATAAVPSS